MVKTQQIQLVALLVTLLLTVISAVRVAADDGPNDRHQQSADHVRMLQTQAIKSGKARWGRWGPNAGKYSSWTTHSNRLIPVYTFGIGLDRVSGDASPYRSTDGVKRLYEDVPKGTVNPDASYFDQTGVYELQKLAAANGKKRIILFVFDGMDWQATLGASTYRAGKVRYDEGRGSGLHFQDYAEAPTDYGWFVTSPHNNGSKTDVDSQTVLNPGGTQTGGYAHRIGGEFPWSEPLDPLYPIGKGREFSHAYTDSAASATSLCAGLKTYNGSINVAYDGKPVVPIARELQEDGFAIGVVTSVPVSHATPASAYANNVSRNDYQDLTRDLLGLKSVSHPEQALPGVDVLIGAGHGVERPADAGQGSNFVPGNRYLTQADLEDIDAGNGGDWQTVVRTQGTKGSELLSQAAWSALETNRRLFGYFGTRYGHLPFQTADGGYNPTVSVPRNPTARADPAESYSSADVAGNPTLADMTSAALQVLSARSERFWLMVEAGDVDWAMHANNIDNCIGAVLSGDAAFHEVTRWIEQNGGWKDTAVIVTSDHGHYLVLNKPELLVREVR